MSLSDEERERLADIVRLQPTKNSELQDRWDMESGSEVHQYLENHLKEYYYRDDNSLIRATSEAADLTGVEPAVEDERGEGGVPETVRVPTLQAQIVEVLAGPDEETESVVSVLNKLREAFDVDPEAGDVRRGLQSLRRKNVVEVVYRTVPTFRLAVARDELTVESVDESSADGASGSSDGESTDAQPGGSQPEDPVAEEASLDPIAGDTLGDIEEDFEQF